MGKDIFEEITKKLVKMGWSKSYIDSLDYKELMKLWENETKYM